LQIDDKPGFGLPSSAETVTKHQWKTQRILGSNAPSSAEVAKVIIGLQKISSLLKYSGKTSKKKKRGQIIKSGMNT
jgi:hypothetical protein